jgi:hypothetical protein
MSPPNSAILFCLTCGDTLSEENESDEHLVPNALGGWLSTRRATCTQCNSEWGHGPDLRLIEAFKLLANELDVPRHRGVHPIIPVRDENTGLRYVVVPGKGPRVEPNMAVTIEGDRRTISVRIPSRDDAEQVVKTRVRPAERMKGVSELTVVTSTAPPPTYELLRLSALDDGFFRALAKVALSYCRFRDVSVSSTSACMQLLRGRDVADTPIWFPKAQVVDLDLNTDHPLYHGLFLRRCPDGGPLLAHIVLFGAFEACILVDENSDGEPFVAGDVMNLLTGSPQHLPFTWHLDADEFRKNVAEGLPTQRMMYQFQSVFFWMQNRHLLWSKRAEFIATKVFRQAMSQGGDEAAARALAEEQGRRHLSQYGIELERLEWTQS